MGLASPPFICLITGNAQWVMLTIQWVPNWSVSDPASSPHDWVSSGIVTVPPAESLVK